jgi:hypothetical protein
MGASLPKLISTFALASAMTTPTTTKKQKVASFVEPLVYKAWPSSLTRAGHTTICVNDPSEPLYKFLNSVQPDDHYGIRMGRRAKLPCLLQPSSKFRHGAERWWCPVHQGQFGLKAQLREASRTGVRKCDHSHERVDFVRAADIPVFCLSDKSSDDDDGEDPNSVKKSSNEYCELGIWIGLPPAIDTTSCPKDGSEQSQRYYYPGIHVHARKVPQGPKVVDANFPAVTVRDHTGRYPQLMGQGFTITSPAALEFLYFMENECPINRRKRDEGKKEANGNESSSLIHRTKVELVGNVLCKHCKTLHEDIGDFFGQQTHLKHLCGQCGRQIFSAGRKPNIGNPLLAFRRRYRREVAGVNIDQHNAVLKLDSSQYRSLMMWPSTPAIFWSRDAPEIWGIHVHALSEHGRRAYDDTYGEVWLDGTKLDRAELFRKMIEGTAWLQNEELEVTAIELEDD